jgi:D-alanyl-D-alanine carboxypeptidase
MWTPQEILENFVGPANFKPGKGVRYSNTNYLLLGLIIESITGNSVADEFSRRLLSKLDLRETWSCWSDTVDGDMLHGWSIGFDDTDPMKQTDISSIPSTAILSAAWTAGGMVSTASDLARWADALYSGRVISSSSLEDMFTFRTGSDGGVYGLGAFRYPYGSQRLYGHTGGLLGYSSWIFSAPDDSLSVSVLVNSFHSTIDNGLNRFALAILDELYRPAPTNSVAQDAGAIITRIVPNPVIDRATVEYSVPSRSRVAVEVVDAVGRTIATVKDEMQEMGHHAATIDLDGVAAGAYFCVVRVGGDVKVMPVQVME